MIPLSYLAFSADYCWVSQSNVRYSKVTSTDVSTVEVTLRIYVFFISFESFALHMQGIDISYSYFYNDSAMSGRSTCAIRLSETLRMV